MLSDEEIKKANEEWEEAGRQAEEIRTKITPRLVDMLKDLEGICDLVNAPVFTALYWQRERDIKALRFICNCLEEYVDTGECTKIHSYMCDMYVYDKTHGKIHRIGEHDHDSICTNLGYVDYYNLQCGDGGSVDDRDGYGYVIIKTEHGFLADEYGIIDRRYVKEILQYLKDKGEDISEFDEKGNRLHTDE